MRRTYVQEQRVLFALHSDRISAKISSFPHIAHTLYSITLSFKSLDHIRQVCN